MSAFEIHAQVEPTAPVLTTPATTASSEEVVKLESFSVTGSNIRRMDQEKVLPVTVFTSADIQARDSVTPVDMLSAIPQITNIPANETSVNAVAARGDNANVALRGIGSQNTLVIMNGRRMPFHPFNTSSVNVNTLPTSGIGQVEVLRDGASAVYGSDAVAGVINYVMRKDLNGGEISARYGVTEHGGGMDGQVNISFGKPFANGKGRWVTNATAYNRDAIYLYERDYSATTDKIALARPPFNVAGSPYDGLRGAASFTPLYRIGAANISTAATMYYRDPATGNQTAIGTATSNFPRALTTNYNEYAIGQPFSTRYNLYNSVEYDLTENLMAFAEVSGYYSESVTGRQPITLASSDAVVTVSVDNPYNPLGSRFYNPAGTPNADGTARIAGTPQALTITQMLMGDGGPEKIDDTDRTYRLLGGLKGRLGTSTWTWETAAMLGGVRATDFATNEIRDSLIKAAAMRTDASAWNPFGYTYKVVNGAVVVDKAYVNPKSVRDTYTVSANRYGHSKIASGDLRAGGDVFQYWAGSLAASFGVEWRYEFKEDHKDPYVSFNPPDSGLNPDDNDILVMSPKANYEASRTIASGYGETVAPLVSPQNNVPLIYSLELNASGRFERYSDFGNTTKPKFGANWKPASWMMVRGSINKGFRAPDLADLYQGAAFGVATPPGTRDAVRNNYFTGVGQPSDDFQLTRTYTLSNKELQPEESTGKSIGLAFDVPQVKGLSFTADYWEIEQKNLILAQTRDAARDAEILLAYTQAQLAAGRSYDSIDTGYRITPDGVNTYVGDPYTLRNPVTAQDRARFAAANALVPQNQWIAPVGTLIGSVSQQVNNTGKNYTNGFDFSATYSLPKTALGQFRISTDWTKILNKFAKVTPTSPKNDDINAMLLPEWKGTTTLQWRQGGWSATASGVYSTDIRTGATTTKSVYDSLGQPDYIRVVVNNGTTTYYEEGYDQFQLNLGVSYNFGPAAKSFWLKDTTVRLGINNALDEEPSLQATAAGYSGATGSSLWVGRAYSLNVTRKF